LVAKNRENPSFFQYFQGVLFQLISWVVRRTEKIKIALFATSLHLSFKYG